MKVSLYQTLLVLSVLFLTNLNCNFDEPEIDDSVKSSFTAENFFADGTNFGSNTISALAIKNDVLYVGSRGGGFTTYDIANNSWDDLGYDDSLNSGGNLETNAVAYNSPNKVGVVGDRVLIGFEAGLGSDGLVGYSGVDWNILDYFGSDNDVADILTASSAIYISNKEYGTQFNLPDPAGSYDCDFFCGQVRRLQASGNITGGSVDIANSTILGSSGDESENLVDFPENVELLLEDSQGSIIGITQRWSDPEDIEHVGTSGDPAEFNCEIGDGCRLEIAIVRLDASDPSQNINDSGNIIELETNTRFDKTITSAVYERVSASKETIWIGTTEGLIQVNIVFTFSLQTAEVIYTEDSSQQSLQLLDNNITAMTKNNQGIWIGSNSGISLLANNVITHVDAEETGLPEDTITSLTADEDSNELWVGSLFGLSKVTPNENN